MGGLERGRRDPQSWGAGWEVPAIALGGGVIVLVLAALAGMGAAAAWFGGGWVWPHGSEQLVRAAAGLASGHPGQGLPAASAARLPGRGWVYAGVAAAEALAVAVLVAVAVLAARLRGPGGTRGGMATRGEAAAALGVGQLRAARRIIRPDLYGPRRKGTP